MFKEDIKIKILDEEHFNKVKEILVKEGYKFPTNINSSTKCYYLTAYQSCTTPYINYGHFPGGFDTHINKEYILWVGRLVHKDDFYTPEPEGSNKIVEKEINMVEQNKEPKNKPKTQSQLVFTYTNGKKYVVRGLQQVRVFLNGSKFQVDYTHATYDGVKHQTSNVSVYVTNELVKVEKINTDNSVEVVLDLSSISLNSAKAQEGPKKPRSNARSKEEYEAMLEAKKSQDERNKALVEAKARELAAKMLKKAKSK